MSSFTFCCPAQLQPDNISDLRKNYFKLSRLVHPDKCGHPDAAAAQAVVTQVPAYAWPIILHSLTSKKRFHSLVKSNLTV